MEWAHQSMTDLDKKLLWIFAGNFIAFWIIAVLLGGDALNGQIEDGQYLLQNHGVDRAVHPIVWYYSAIHASITLGSFVLFLIYNVFRRWF